MTTPSTLEVKDKKDVVQKKRGRTQIHTNALQPQLVEPFTPVTLSAEQLMYLEEILQITSSDNQFAAKALRSIVYLLNPPAGAELTSLTPATAAIGDPSFQLHVHGTGFDPGSRIFWNGSEEPTTVVSPTELTTNVDMTTAVVPMKIPVVVESGTGEASNPLEFDLTAAAGGTQSFTTKPLVPDTKPVPEVKK